MSGTTLGGKHAAATIYKIHGKDFYREIGRKGGKNGHTGGFAANPKLARLAGSVGGRKSRRGKDPKRDERIARAKELSEQGWKIQKIADEMDLTYATVQRYLTKY